MRSSIREPSCWAYWWLSSPHWHFPDPPTLGLVAGALLLFLAWQRLLTAWLRLLRSVWFLAIVVLAVDFVYYGPAGALIAVVKLLLLVSLFSSFFLSTDTDNLAAALISLKVPHTFAFILAASANYVPVVGQEAREISDAFQARGISRGHTPIGLLRFYGAILVPLVVATIRRSLRLSEALEARAFGSSRRRSSLRLLRFKREDALFSAASAAAFAGLVLAHVR